MSPLQAFMTSLAATIGTGNIAGVATAIVSGGPGALFWIWCYGFFAMATKFSEASLGMHFRVAHGEEVLAGPMYYLRDGLKSPALAWIFAFVAGIGVHFHDAAHATKFRGRGRGQSVRTAPPEPGAIACRWLRSIAIIWLWGSSWRC